MPAAPSFALLALATIRESWLNPRKTFDQTSLAELTASIAEKGVLQPVLVRPGEGGHYELVFGHRRVRAARAAGLTHIPATVAALDDRQVLEAQMVENAQRQDVHPLEEADGYRRLHETYSYSAEDIAAKVGKSVSYIYGRMKLCALCEAGRQAFLAGELDASRALLIARIPHQDLQEKAVARLTARRSWAGDEPMGYREAVRTIQREFMLRLAEAPFATKACAKCPRRTGAQPALFADVDSPDLCTDPACYAEKTEAAWEARKKKAEKSGQKVLSDAEVKELMPYGHVLYGSGWASLDDRCPQDSKARTWRELLGRDATEHAALARTDAGVVVELVVAEDALDDLREAGVLAEPEAHEAGTPAPAVPSKWELEQAEREERKERAHRLAIGECAARAEAGELGEEIWRLLARLSLSRMWSGVDDDVAERRGLEVGEEEEPRDALRRFAATAPWRAVRGLALELAVALASQGHQEGAEDVLREVCAACKVDLARLEAAEAPEEDVDEDEAARRSPHCALAMNEVPKHCADCEQTHCAGRVEEQAPKKKVRKAKAKAVAEVAGE